MKSTVDEIRQRFDRDVERFANLETGQRAAVDGRLMMDLVAAAAAATNPDASRLLDVGCGAGNYALRLLHEAPGLQVDLVDLSQPMLDRAVQRLEDATPHPVTAWQGDIRTLPLDAGRYDIIVAAATLHHLRGEDEWAHVFGKLYDALVPGGSLWIADLVAHSTRAVHALMWQRYEAYLEQVEDAAYRDRVVAYIEKEDTPRPLMFQVDLLRTAGFRDVEILHKRSAFAAFGGVK